MSDVAYLHPDEDAAKVTIDEIGMLVRDAGALSSALGRPQTGSSAPSAPDHAPLDEIAAWLEARVVRG